MKQPCSPWWPRRWPAGLNALPDRATQLRDVVDRLVTAEQWKPGDPNIVIVADTGYDITRLAHVLADLPVELVGRLRCDRVLRLPKPSCFAVFVDHVPAAAQAARTARVSCGVACSGHGLRNLAAMMTRRSLTAMSS